MNLDIGDHSTIHFDIQVFTETTQPSEVGSVSHKSCATSAHATTLKILHRKRFRKRKKIIAPQAQV